MRSLMEGVGDRVERYYGSVGRRVLVREWQVRDDPYERNDAGMPDGVVPFGEFYVFEGVYCLLMCFFLIYFFFI